MLKSFWIGLYELTLFGYFTILIVKFRIPTPPCTCSCTVPAIYCFVVMTNHNFSVVLEFCSYVHGGINDENWKLISLFKISMISELLYCSGRNKKWIRVPKLIFVKRFIQTYPFTIPNTNLQMFWSLSFKSPSENIKKEVFNQK